MPIQNYPLAATDSIPRAAHPWGEAPHVFRALAGDWTLDRRIEGVASMVGRATFAALPGQACLAYVERGLLRLNTGATFDAERRYSFRGTPRGFDVFFAETPPRLFHEIVLAASARGLVGEAEHRCNADHYASRYDFLADGAFTIVHAVDGPRKRYVSQTRFSRT